jgi:hypothetical protein
MQKISCGPGGTHTRPHGEVLPHRSPRGHDTSLIQRSTLSTNQEQSTRIKGPTTTRSLARNTVSTLIPTLGPTWTKSGMNGATPRLADPPRLANPTLRPLSPPFHVSACQKRCQVPARIFLRNPAAPHGRFTNLAPTPQCHVSPPHLWLPRQPRAPLGL